MNNTAIYLLQVQTDDFEVLVRTEVNADTISELKRKSKVMVANNNDVRGMNYRIFSVIGNHKDGFISKMLKEDLISLN